MSFFKTLSEKLGFIADESDDDRNDDELEDGEIQDEEDEEEEEDARPSRFSLNNPFGKGKKQAASGRRSPPQRNMTRTRRKTSRRFAAKAATATSFTIPGWIPAPRRKRSTPTASALSTFVRLRNAAKSSNICFAAKAFC